MKKRLRDNKTTERINKTIERKQTKLLERLLNENKPEKKVNVKLKDKLTL